MKVLHLTTHLNTGGITSYILLLSQELQKRNIEIQVASSGGEQESHFTRHHIKTFILPLKTKSELSPKLIHSFFLLKKLYAQEKWDFIHAHTRVTQYLAFWLSHFLKIPFLSTMHGFHSPHLGRKMFPCLGTKTISISNAVKDFLEKEYAHPSTLIHHGINTQVFHPCSISDEEKTRLKEDIGLKNIPTLGNIGRLSQEKGHAYLIEILHALRNNKKQNVQLLILGEGKEKKEIFEKIKSYHLEDHVFLIPSHPNPHKILSLIDLYVSYHKGPEGLGLSFLEAMAMEKPLVVSYKLGGFTDFLEDGKEGFLLKEGSLQDMIEKIDLLLSFPKLQKQMGKRGLEKIHAFFSLEHMIDKTQKLYETII